MRTSKEHGFKCLNPSAAPEVMRTKAQKEKRRSDGARPTSSFLQMVEKMGSELPEDTKTPETMGEGVRIPGSGKRLKKNGWPQKKKVTYLFLRGGP